MIDDLTVNIPLHNRKREVVGYAIVDAEDASVLSQWRWHMVTAGALNKSHYAVRYAPTEGAQESGCHAPADHGASRVLGWARGGSSES